MFLGGCGIFVPVSTGWLGSQFVPVVDQTSPLWHSGMGRALPGETRLGLSSPEKRHRTHRLETCSMIQGTDRGKFVSLSHNTRTWRRAVKLSVGGVGTERQSVS